MERLKKLVALNLALLLLLVLVPFQAIAIINGMSFPFGIGSYGVFGEAEGIFADSSSDTRGSRQITVDVTDRYTFRAAIGREDPTENWFRIYDATGALLPIDAEQTDSSAIWEYSCELTAGRSYRLEWGDSSRTSTAGSITLWTSETYKKSYHATIYADDGVDVSTNISDVQNMVPAGETVLISAADYNDNVFAHWEVLTHNVSLNNAYSANTSFIMPSGNVVIKAMYSMKGDKSSVTVRPNSYLGGEVAADKSEAAPGDLVNLSAIVKSGYEFERWDVLSANVTLSDVYSPNTSFTMPSTNVSLMAFFKQVDLVVDIPEIKGVIPPSVNSTPVTKIIESAQYTGAVAWSPNHPAFDYNTSYTAMISLTPKSGYTLTGVPANFFTVAGATSTSNDINSGVITAVFSPIELPIIKYASHVEKLGNQPFRTSKSEGGSNENDASHYTGTVGQGLRLEQLSINTSVGKIIARGHVQKVGWMPETSGQNVSIGTTGEGLRLEAVKLSLDGVPGYALRYKVHLEEKGWTDWAYQGQICGTLHESRRIEAVIIEIVKKPESGVFNPVEGNCVGSAISRNTVLNSGDYLLSPNKNYIAYMQHDGNFTVYNIATVPWQVKWESNTMGKGKYFVFQSDENLVIYPNQGAAVWSPNINGKGASRLVMQDDGNLVAYTSQNNPVWSTLTGLIKRELNDKKDNFSFTNSREEFFGFFQSLFSPKSGTYAVTGEYYDYILQAASIGGATYQQAVLDKMKKSWSGSCFGMSAVLALTKAGRLTPSFFQKGASNLYNLDKPSDSSTVRNLINYYHLMVLTKTTAYARRRSPDESTNLHTLVQKMKGSAYPVIIIFNIYTNETNKERGIVDGCHAVIGYDIEETADNYVIKIWDPNDTSFKSKTLSIRKDFSKANFNYKYSTVLIEPGLAVEDGEYDYLNIQDALSGIDVSQVVQTNMNTNKILMTAVAAASTELAVNYRDFTILSSNGKSATVSNGIKTGGTLEIEIGVAAVDGYLPEDTQNTHDLKFYIPNLEDGETYTITPSGDGVSQYQTHIHYADIQNGYYTRVSTETAGSYIFGAGGKVGAEFSGIATVTIASTLNGLSNDLYTTTVFTKDSAVNIGINETRNAVVTSKTSDAEISVSGDYAHIVFDSVDVSDSVKILQDENSVRIMGNSGLELESKEIPKSLVKCAITVTAGIGGRVTGGGSHIKGSDVTVEALPDNGYNFAGWYENGVRVSTDIRYVFTVMDDRVLEAQFNVNGNPSPTPPYYPTPAPTPVPTPAPTPSVPPVADSIPNSVIEMPQTAGTFSDVAQDAWYYNDVMWVYKNGLMTGIGGSLFSPAGICTNAETVMVLARMANIDLSRYADVFTRDLPERPWYRDAIMWARVEGLYVYYPGSPTKEITRGEMAVMLDRYIRWVLGVNLQLPSEPFVFADAGDMTTEQQRAFQTLCEIGIFNGRGGGKMEPKGIVTRAEIAALTRRLSKFV